MTSSLHTAVESTDLRVVGPDNAPLALRVDQATSRSGALFASPVRSLLVSWLFLTRGGAAGAEEDEGDEVAEHRRPCEAVSVCAEACILVGAAELVASFYGPSAVLEVRYCGNQR